MDGILFREFFCQGDTQLIEVGEGILGNLGAGCAAEEECAFGVFDGFGGFFV